MFGRPEPSREDGRVKDEVPTPARKLYGLALHGETRTGNLRVTRVPGGWIYEDVNSTFGVFVPYDDEFDDDGA